MSHKPNKLDIVTDLRRCLYASFNANGFESENALIFIKKAEEKLNALKNKINKENYLLIKQRIQKAKNANSSLSRRREDLLTASVLI